MNKKKIVIAYLICYIIGVAALTTSSDPVPFYLAIFQAIPGAFVLLGIGYGVYYGIRGKKIKEERILQEQMKAAEEQQKRVEQERKRKIESAAKMPCPACGAPVSVLSPKCEYCGTANPNYKE